MTETHLAFTVIVNEIVEHISLSFIMLFLLISKHYVMGESDFPYLPPPVHDMT